MTIRAAALGGLAILTIACAPGCQLDYPWDVEVPQVGDSVKDLSCGATISGAMQWNRLDGNDYPSVWTEICHIRWELEGTLTTAYDAGDCFGCRCVYDIVGTVVHDSCDWYGSGEEHTFQLGFTPTVSGPEDYQGWAAEWPWLAYTDYTPSWDDALDFCYLARDDDTALPESYDAGEMYLYSYWYWTFSESTDVMKLQAWVGMSE